MDITGNLLEHWLTTVGLKIVLIIAVTWLLKRFGMIVVERIIRNIIKPDQFSLPSDEKQREDTLIAIFHGVFNVVWTLIALMMILEQLGIDVGPLIASAGIVGVALGFGGQWLIRDLIAGLFIVVENQFRVGDIVTFYIGAGGTQTISGRVEDISARLTILRDLDGEVHHVPNGTIAVATNMSKEFSGINLDIVVPLETDLDKLIKVINDVGRKLANDKQWEDKILTPPAFLRIDDLTSNGMTVKITGKTLPMEQWSVTGELRRHLKLAFDKAKIKLKTTD